MADPTSRMGAPQSGYIDPLSRQGTQQPSYSGLTEDEARGFHRMFVVSFLIYVAIAIVAHYAVWQWRPWIPGVAGYKVSAVQTTPALTNSTATAVATR